MKCPVCQVDLQMTDRQGIEVDYCPKCRGVWLDRGELDKLIERSTAQLAGRPSHEADDRGRDRDYDDDDDDYRGRRPHKKKSMWREIFDFG